MIPRSLRTPRRQGLARFPVVLLASLMGAALVVGIVTPLPAEWYASDRFGILREEIDEASRAEHGHTLFVERDPDLERHYLYEGDDEIALIEHEYASGLLREIRRYESDDLVATERYRYWIDGSVRRVTLEAAGERTVEYRYREGSLYQEWSYGEIATERTDYDQVGRLVRRILWEDDVETERETREYWGPLATDLVRRIVLVSDGVQTERSFDESGRLLGSSTAREGEVESSIERIFRDGLLVEERDDRSVPPRRWTYEYDGETLVAERYYEGEVIVKETRHDSPDADRLEIIYDDGQPGLRVYYENERRFREELLRDGEVFRVRDFQPVAEPSDEGDES